MSVKQTGGRAIVLYERLSRDDDNTGDSNSIINQKKYLESYARQEDYTNCHHYTDDDRNSGNFGRPVRKQLVAGTEAGKAAHVTVKDMSRAGRSYLQTGFCMEVFFRQHDVHFVAIANSMDGDDQNSNELTPFLNTMNKWYLRDLSHRQRTAVRIKGEPDKPTTNCTIYGYKKDPESKYHRLIDEEAAAMVRRIFRLTIEGKGPYNITRILFEDKVETPTVYFGKQGEGIWKSKEGFSNPHDWSGYVVGQIPSRPECTGHTMNFCSYKQFYKDKNVVMNPREGWLIFEDTHEAIVDRKTWELAQKLRKTPRRTDTLGEVNPLTGLVFCADYRAKVYNHRPKGGMESNPYPSDFFDYSPYTLARQKRTAACCGHYIMTKILHTLILDTVRMVNTPVISNQAAFMEKVRSASQFRQIEAAKDAKRKLSKDKRCITRLDIIIKKFYESFAVGRITDERFDSLLADYEIEQRTPQISATEAEERLFTFVEDNARMKQFLELARKYANFSELTTPMIDEFIGKIIVHAPECIDGDRAQEVEIHLRFIGQSESPAPELIEEGTKWQEFLKRERTRSRECYQKSKSGERTMGVPVTLTCKCCEQEFVSKQTDILFCGPNCYAKFYRQGTAGDRSRACTCENCDKEFTAARSDVKYCSGDRRYVAQIKRQDIRKRAPREVRNEKETETTQEETQMAARPRSGRPPFLCRNRSIMCISEIIKENVNLRKAAKLYRTDVNRYGKVLYPFHNNRRPSLYMADDHYYYFVCGEHGDMIGFISRLFQLSSYSAARKLMVGFHLSPDKPSSAAVLHAKYIRTKVQQLMGNKRLCFPVLSGYTHILRDWKMRYTPQSPDVPAHA